MGTVRFRNDNFEAITGYGDYIQGNITIWHVYYVEGLGHNLFSVGQFCDGDLEVAFRSKTCYVRNLEGDDLLTGDRESNLYSISISDIAASSPVYETPEIIKKFIAQAQLNYKAKVCKIRTDNGTEFKNATLKAHYEKLGIMQQFSTPRTPQQNGVVKRCNRTLVEAARTMLIFSRLPEFLWAEAVATASKEMNTPSKEDLDNLFSPMFEEYFEKTFSDTPINSAAQPTQIHKDSPSTSSIIIDEHKAPPIVTTSDEQTSPISLIEANEFNQEDSVHFDGNSQFVSYNPPSSEEIKSSTTALES
ncbi:retrovirus-related pol polyprotein from transposon TNT 1-94 [Tanacetum coccineum]